MLFLLCIILLIAALWAIFFFELSRIAGSATLIILSLIVAWVSPWSLLLGLALILISLLVLIEPLRMRFISQPAYKTLANAMPSMSSTEREALDAGTSWWEKELFMEAPDWKKFDAYPYPELSAEEQSFLDNEVEQLCKMVNEWDIHHQYKDLPLKHGSLLKITDF